MRESERGRASEEGQKERERERSRGIETDWERRRDDALMKKREGKGGREREE